VDNTYLETIKNFKYLSCEISYEYEQDILKKILGIPNHTFKPTLVQKFSRIKVYNALSLPILVCGIEIGTLRKKGKND